MLQQPAAKYCKTELNNLGNMSYDVTWLFQNRSDSTEWGSQRMFFLQLRLMFNPMDVNSLIHIYMTKLQFSEDRA